MMNKSNIKTCSICNIKVLYIYMFDSIAQLHLSKVVPTSVISSQTINRRLEHVIFLNKHTASIVSCFVAGPHVSCSEC